MRAHQLRTESLTDPVGIDRRQPRFSWVVASARRGARQSAYQIQVRDVAGPGDDCLWDSGKVVSRDTHHIAYVGPELATFQSLQWRVRVWDESSDGLGVLNTDSPPFATGLVRSIEHDLSLRIDGREAPVTRGRVAFEEACVALGL